MSLSSLLDLNFQYFHTLKESKAWRQWDQPCGPYRKAIYGWWILMRSWANCRWFTFKRQIKYPLAMIRVISGCQNSVLPVKINKNFKLLCLIISVCKNYVPIHDVWNVQQKKYMIGIKLGPKSFLFSGCFEIMRFT